MSSDELVKKLVNLVSASFVSAGLAVFSTTAVYNHYLNKALKNNASYVEFQQLKEKLSTPATISRQLDFYSTNGPAWQELMAKRQRVEELARNDGVMEDVRLNDEIGGRYFKGYFLGGALVVVGLGIRLESK